MIFYLQLAVLALAASQAYGKQRLNVYCVPKTIAKPITYKLYMGCNLAKVIETPEPATRRRRAVTETETDVISIKSVEIFKDGTRIAHVSQLAPAEATVDQTNLKVNGAVGQFGSLALEWDKPGDEQVGVYTCEIAAEDEDGKEVTFSDSCDIGAKDAGQAEVIQELVTQHRHLEERPIPRTQTGRGKCGESTSWINGPTDLGLTGSRFATVEGRFDPPVYPDPVFTVAVAQVDAVDSLRFKLNVREVTSSGFKVECVTWGGATIKGAEFTWSALTGPAEKQLFK